MPKLLPNRVSKVISLEIQLSLKSAVEAFNDALGEPTAVTDAEVNKLLKVASTRKRIMDDILLVMDQHPAQIKPPLTLTEIRKDKTLFEYLDEAEVYVLGLLFNIRREKAVCGAEYANAGGVFESDVKAEVDRNNPDARIAKAKLDAIDRRKGGNPGTTPPPTP